MWRIAVPMVDEFEFGTFMRDTRGWQDTPDIRGFGMPDMNFDGRVDNADLMMLVMFHLQQQMDDDGTTMVYTTEGGNRATNTLFAAANDAETGNSVGGTFNPGTGEYNISFF
jgi:hypothetical protein